MHPVLESLPKKAREQLQEKKMPGFVEPMTAKLVHDYFSDPDWIYERKLDGERCLAYHNGKKVTLFSRNKKNKNRTYPEIAEFIGKTATRFVVDCEIVTFMDKVTSFSQLQKRIHHKSPNEKLKQEVPVFAYLFDVIWFEGYSLEALELSDRKKVLKNGFSFDTPLHYLPHRNEDGEAYLRQACGKGWEGLIAKRKSSTYQHKRSGNWLKFKCGHRQELVIGGYTKPQGKRIGFGALLMGYYDDGQFCYAGRVGTGFDDKLLEKLHNQMAQMQVNESPFEKFDEAEKNIHWVKPKLVGEVGFTQWTRSGKLRHPRFLGLRDDKRAKDVHKEQAA